MIVRYEKIRGSSNLLIINEINKYLGEVTEADFIESMLDEDPFEEGDFLYFHVDKNLLSFCFV